MKLRKKMRERFDVGGQNCEERIGKICVLSHKVNMTLDVLWLMELKVSFNILELVIFVVMLWPPRLVWWLISSHIS